MFAPRRYFPSFFLMKPLLFSLSPVACVGGLLPRRISNRGLASAVVGALWLVVGWTPARGAALAEGEIPAPVLAALVQVEAFVQMAEGEEPAAAGWSQRCPKCGEYHVNGLDDALADERPAAVGGYLVAPDRVLAPDPMIHPRFVREWRVRLGAESVTARPVAWAADRKAVLFALERPLAAGRPLVFSPQASGPYSVLTYSLEGDGWGALVQPLGGSWLTRPDGRRFQTVPGDSIVLAADGSPVAPLSSEILPLGEAWKAPFASWPWLDEAAYRDRLAAVESAASDVILHATLQLRPVPVQPGEDPSSDSDEDANATTLHASALVLGPGRVLVLRGLAPAVTARLESVTLTRGDGTVMPARFVASVVEFGALVVEPEQPLPATVRLAATPWREQRDRLLFAAEIRVKGEERRAHYRHLRSAATGVGLKGRDVPEFAGATEGLFVFDQEGRLVGAPLAKRADPGAERWASAPDPFTVQADELRVFADEPAAWADARNVPRSAADERSLGWLGVELQPLDRDLAQAHGVSAQTEEGQSGALVTYVYPDSPAGRVGLVAGDVLLRILPAGTQRAVPVRVEAFAFSDQPFPWDRYDQIPDAYFDRIPRPWAPAENALGALLKEFGFDSAYRLDYARGGKLSTLDLTVERGPDHYGSAPEAVATAYGLRLRELTFETRRFYQIPAGQPGLLVARIEAGGPGAVAGLKPYEVVTAVNDQPVSTVAEFESAVAVAQPLRLGVRRMHQTRLVTVIPTAAPGAP